MPKTLSLEPVNMFLYMARRIRLHIEIKLLIRWPYNREIILNYLNGLTVITRALKSWSGKQKSSSWCHAGLKMEEGDQLPVMQQPLEVEKGNKMHPTKSLQKRMQLCQHLTETRIYTSDLQNCKIINLPCLNL